MSSKGRTFERDAPCPRKSVTCVFLLGGGGRCVCVCVGEFTASFCG